MEHWKAKVYKTKLWTEEIRPYIFDREDGKCQYCGALILGSYHVHHIIELTEQNYQDYNIAFNVDNLMLLHKECHDMIHERFGYKKTIVNDDLSINYERR